jgi:hypothetical protein
MHAGELILRDDDPAAWVNLRTFAVAQPFSPHVILKKLKLNE